MAQVIERGALTVTALFVSALQGTVKERMISKIQSLVSRQLHKQEDFCEHDPNTNKVNDTFAASPVTK